MMRSVDESDTPTVDQAPSPSTGNHIAYVKVGDIRSEGDEDTCLRPLGLCELGGSCDSCWYRPDHPRFRKQG